MVTKKQENRTTKESCLKSNNVYKQSDTNAESSDDKHQTMNINNHTNMDTTHMDTDVLLKELDDATELLKQLQKDLYSI